jgi:hypothetical protein
MKNEKENKLNETWETPEMTVLNVNENTKFGVGPGDDGDLGS